MSSSKPDAVSQQTTDSWIAIMRADDVPEGGVVAVEVGERVIAIYHLEGGEFFATDAFCTHGAALLSDGIVDGDIIECPLHGGCFEIRSGKGLGDPITEDLRTFGVRIVDEQIEINCRTGAR
jgi:nitrite reductase/ring-hydroxylating ferredoxin subunit